MDIKTNVVDSKMTIAIVGRIDTTTAPVFEAEINKITNETELVIDFAGVEYISSAGLRVVLKAQKLMNSLGKMKLVNVNDDVMDVFDITGFVDILTIE